MRLSDALETGAVDPLAIHWARRYGFQGSLEDAKAMAVWLRTLPHVDVQYEPAAGAAVSKRLQRPYQAAFRQTVGQAYGWRCAITGCDEASVLEAAHLRGWQKGNSANDGILLRVDLHRLLDAGLLTILPDLTIRVSSTTYAELDGRKLRLPKNRQDWPRVL